MPWLVLTVLDHFCSFVFVSRREKTRLEQLQQEQKIIEENNKRKKALLAKTIAEKYVPVACSFCVDIAADWDVFVTLEVFYCPQIQTDSGRSREAEEDPEGAAGSRRHGVKRYRHPERKDRAGQLGLLHCKVGKK